jgi:hypothetical protein
MAYSATLRATGGTGTLTWSFGTGNNLPAWLNLDPATGVVSGTPPSSQIFNFNVQVTDSGSPHQTATGNFVISILQTVGINTSGIVPGNRSIPYDTFLVAFGGTFSFTFSLQTGNLPPGLNLSSRGEISGTPTQAGIYTFTVQAADSGPPAQIATADITIEVKSVLQLLPTNLVPGIQGRSYNQTLQVVNGTQPLHWGLAGLPSGMTIGSTSGTIGGTPTAQGNFGMDLTVTDSSVPAQTYSTTLGILIYGTLQITSTDLGNVVVNQVGSVGVPFTGGVAPVTAQVVSAVPPGISINTSNTELILSSGQLGTYSFDVKLTDSASPPQQAQATFTVHVVPLPPFINIPVLPRGIVGRAYSFGLSGQHGTPPYSWSISSGSLPDGLMLDSQGLIHGTPTTVGNPSFTVLLTDSGAPTQTSTAILSIQILAHALGRNDSIATATPISNNVTNGSISPFSDPSSVGPDGDYYKLTANPGATVFVSVLAKRLSFASTLDSVLEIVDVSGTRFTTCNDPVQPFLKAPAVLDPNPNDFNNSCINDDDPNTNTTDSNLQFKVPGTSGPPVTFYIHVLDFRGDARPDMVYELGVSGAN